MKKMISMVLSVFVMMSVCCISVLAEPENIALGKAVFSQYASDGSGILERINDGDRSNKFCIYNHENNISRDGKAFLRIDLGAVYDVSEVKIWSTNGEATTANIGVYTSLYETSFSQMDSWGEFGSAIPAEGDASLSMTQETPKACRYVALARSNGGLWLSEVEVFGTPNDTEKSLFNGILQKTFTQVYGSRNTDWDPAVKWTDGLYGLQNMAPGIFNKNNLVFAKYDMGGYYDVNEVWIDLRGNGHTGADGCEIYASVEDVTYASMTRLATANAADANGGSILKYMADAPVKARYIVVYRASTDQELGFDELEIHCEDPGYTDPLTYNVAKGKSYEASHATSNNTAGKLIDGDYSIGRSGGLLNERGGTFKVDLENYYEIDQVLITIRSDQEPQAAQTQGIRVLASQMDVPVSEMTEIGVIGDTVFQKGDTWKTSFPQETRYRYVALDFGDESKWRNIAEMQIMARVDVDFGPWSAPASVSGGTSAAIGLAAANHCDMTHAYQFLFTAYDSNGAMLDLTTGSDSLAAGEAKTLSQSYSIPEGAARIQAVILELDESNFPRMVMDVLDIPVA